MSETIDYDIRRSAHPIRSWIVTMLLFLLLQAAAVLLVGFTALFLSITPGWSAEGPPAPLTKPRDARSGALLFKSDAGYAEAPRLGIDVDIIVSGPTARARVTQLFRNTSSQWMEAVYVYPLPPDSAVDTLKMIVGDRVVIGDIKPREQAKVIYEQAKRDGKTAALTEQERPNIFTNSL
ncbi:VIT domain-containing protein, partial [Bradyrhizobium sp.]